MSTRQLPQPRAQWWASDGTPLSGGKIYTYAPGTTTNKPTWRDAQKSVANANPVILDSRGEAVIYWDGEYKVRVTDANDTLIYEQDNYGSGEVPIHNDGAALNPNPGFERDTDGDGHPDGWTITEYEPNTIALDTTTANVESGSAALKFTTTDGGVSGVAVSELVPVSPDEFIYLSARAKTSNTNLKQYVSIQWFNATRNTLGSTAAPKSDLLTSYSDITLSAKSPYSTARYAAIRIDGPNWTGTELGSTWFDECRLERAPAAIIPDNARTLLQAYLSADQSMPGNAVTKIQFDRVNFDVNSEFDTANHKFVAAADGLYRVHARTVIPIDSVYSQATVELLINQVDETTSIDMFNSQSRLLQLSKGDELELSLSIVGDSGPYTLLSGVTYSFMEVERLK